METVKMGTNFEVGLEKMRFEGRRMDSRYFQGGGFWSAH